MAKPVLTVIAGGPDSVLRLRRAVLRGVPRSHAPLPERLREAVVTQLRPTRGWRNDLHRRHWQAARLAGLGQV
jgi:hypothetical protein